MEPRSKEREYKKKVKNVPQDGLRAPCWLAVRLSSRRSTRMSDHASSGSDAEEGDNVEDGQPIRCGRVIATDDEWCSWLREDLQSCPAWQTHSSILEECATIATRWRARFWADRPLWNRIRRGRRLAKELAEAAPVLQQARAAVAALPEGGPPLVILDLCSGFGYLAMFLSELLHEHAARVAKIVLVDIRWPPHGVPPQAHHLSDQHLTAPGWPVRLTTSRCDLKCSSDRRNLARTFLAQGSPAMVLGVHLCGTLSVRAVTLTLTLPPTPTPTPTPAPTPTPTLPLTPTPVLS